jgi:hypothetical protein
VAIDFLPSNAAFEKSSISNITLPLPAGASDGWAIGFWFRLKSSLSDLADRNTINQILQLSPLNDGAWNSAGTVTLWWAHNSNGASIDGTEPVAGKFYATVTDWVAGNNGNAGNWSDAALPADDSDRLLVLQLVNVAGSWKLRQYITAKGASAALVNESPAVTPSALPVSHLRFGDRIPSPGTRDWRDIAGQLFLLGRPLTLAEITALASGTNSITSVAAASDILGYWSAEAPGATLTDASANGNNLSSIGTAASYAGFDFVTSGAASLAAINASHAQNAQAASLVVAGSLAPAQGQHGHSSGAVTLGLAATTLARPSPHGDVDLTLSSVSAATTATPLVTLYGDPEANQNIPNSWHNLCARIDTVLGKTPQFSIANVQEWRNGGAANLGLPERGWRPWWRASGGASTSWQRFDSYSINGNAINFANAAAFAVSSIEVAFFPMWNLDETAALFDAIYTSGVGSEPPAAIAYRATRPTLAIGTHNQTAPVTSPDGILVPALSMRSARLSSAAALSPEGLPKRKAILLFNIHAQEASGGWVADRLIRTLISANADAIWLRDRFVFDCYAVNHTGLVGAASRGVVEGWSGSGDLPDTNRAWPAQITPPNGPLPEVNDVAAAIAQDSNGKADVLFSFHSDALTSANYGLAYYNSAQDGIVAVKQFKDLLIAGSDGLTLALTGDNMAEVSTGLYRDQGFGRHVLGAALSWIQEMTFATSDYLADSQFVATRQLAALRQLTQDGYLPVPLASAAALHAHSAQTGIFTLAGSVLAQRGVHAHSAQSVTLAARANLEPTRATHAHSVQAINLLSGVTALPTRAAHNHIAQSPTLLAGGALAPAGAVHSHSASVATVIAAGVLASARSSHGQRAGAALLSVPGTSDPVRRQRPIANERRTLKLRFS